MTADDASRPLVLIPLDLSVWSSNEEKKDAHKVHDQSSILALFLLEKVVTK